MTSANEKSDLKVLWDDEILIKSYNKSMKLVKEELAKRIASSTNNKDNVKCEKRFSDPQIDFKIADYVRATYDDGIDYEAKITYINEEDGMCVLKYIGYGNEQKVSMCDLIPSWGKKVRRMQFLKAKEELNTDNANASQKSSKKKENKQKFGFDVIPPPPPMPPMIVNSQNDDSEHLSAMLMSWYMSGYYTGIYQGMQLAKKSKAKKK